MRLLLTLLCSLLLHVATAQSIAVTDIPTLGKLPVNAIHRIFQDSQGYMWYGTVNGLCRDDGYQVEVFRSDIYTPGLLDNNLIECIAEDPEGNIWFGTNKGAYILDKLDYSIRPLDSERLKDQFIHRVEATSDGSLWVAIAGYLYRYDAAGNLLHQYVVQNKGIDTHLSGFCESRSGAITVAFAQGLLYYLNEKENQFTPYPAPEKQLHFGNIIQDQEEEYYWIATWQEGIVRFNPHCSNVDSLYLPQSLPTNGWGQTNAVFLYLAQDSNSGYIWGTTSQELVAYCKNEQGMLVQVPLPALFPPSNRMLNEIRKDRSGNLWVSAFDQPSFILHFTDNASTNYPLPALRQRVNGNPAVMALVDTGEGVMWLSQERTGLCLYNHQTDEVTTFLDFPQTKQLPLGSIKIMAQSRLQQSAWVVPVNSKRAYRMARKGMQMELLTQIDLSQVIASGVIRAVLESDSGRFLWLGTDRGAYRYDLEKRVLDSNYHNIGFVTDMVETPWGELWVVTADKGFYVLDKENQLTAFPYLHHYSSVAYTTDNLIWLGSDEGGLYAFNRETGCLVDHSAACDLKGDMVNQVMADEYNHLWIHTNQKLIEFNPSHNSYRSYQTTDSSMLLWRLIPTAMCKGLDGKIYVGGIPGISSFTPSNRLASAAELVKPLITNVKVLGKTLFWGQASDNASLNEVVLTPNDRNIELTFSSLNHRFAHKIRYAYRLIGVDSDWTYTASGACRAYYHTLPKGNFKFEVKATDENGRWSNQVAQLTIRRLPAFYETWWAYTLYLLLLVVALLLTINWYVSGVKKKNNELWSDSQELIKMRHYLGSEVAISEPEELQLDSMLLDKAVKCVEQNLLEPQFDVAALAQGMHMSRSTLTRKLRAITGKTPLEFIRQIKMKHAHQLLANPSTTITEVAANLGYLNRKYFTSCFKEEFGMTPSEYQKSVEKGTIDANRGDK